MSDSQTPAAPALTDLLPPNFAVTSKEANIDGRTTSVLRVTFGEPLRTMELRLPGLGDQLDLIELGGTSYENETWRSMAAVASAVYAIEGVPTPPVRFKGDLKAILNRLEMDGYKAAAAALAGIRSPGDTPPAADAPEGEFRAAVKN